MADRAFWQIHPNRFAAAWTQLGPSIPLGVQVQRMNEIRPAVVPPLDSHPLSEFGRRNLPARTPAVLGGEF
jgi:hypothetical protein